MKKLGITQRVENIIEYNERRDCLDQRLSSLSYHLGFIPLPLPNLHLIDIQKYFDEVKLDAIILSGGNSIGALDSELDDISNERDEFEFSILELAIIRKIPVFGICRGLQIINLFFGGTLSRIQEHVNNNHEIEIESSYSGQLPEIVNSYHNWGINQSELSSELKPIAWDSKMNVEACIHIENPIAGVMWHPEREKPYKKDIEFMSNLLL